MLFSVVDGLSASFGVVWDDDIVVVRSCACKGVKMSLKNEFGECWKVSRSRISHSI